MRLKALLMVPVIVAGTVALLAADQPAKQAWQTVAVPNGEVVIFGNVARAGYYALPEKEGFSLKQLVIAAGLPEKPEGAVVQLRRHQGKGRAKRLEVKIDALNQDGNIELESNDIVQVLSARAG